MKYFIILTLAMFLSFNALSNDTSKSKFGLGFSMNYDHYSELDSMILRRPSAASSPNNILLTFLNSNMKFELQAMVYRSTIELDDYVSGSSLNGDISIGAYALNYLRNDFNTYFGLKFGMVFRLDETDYKDESSYYREDQDNKDIANVYFSPTFGSEYFLSPNFSISGELALKVTVINDDNSDKSQFFINTVSSLLVKWYF